MIPCDAYAKQLQSDHAVLLDMYVFRSISRHCLGQVTKCTLSGLHEFKLFNKSFKSEKSCSMRLKPSCILMTL